MAPRAATRLVRAAAVLGGSLAAWSALADAFLVRPLAPKADDPGHFVSVDGVRTYYRVTGCGPPLVLVHGLAVSHRSWDATTQALAEHHTVYALDLPGFGYSDKPSGFASARQEAAFVDRFLAALEIDAATVIGHSTGGAVALWLAIEHPARIARLVVVDASEIGQAAAVFRLIALPVLGHLLLKTTTPTTMRLLLAHPYVNKEVVTPELARQYARWLWTPGARQALVQHARSYDVDKSALRARLGQVAVPVLIVWTDADPYFPVSVARDLLAALPSARLEVIGGAGHVPQEEQPATFTRIVLGWLAPQLTSTRPAPGKPDVSVGDADLDLDVGPEQHGLVAKMHRDTHGHQLRHFGEVP